MAPLQPLVNPSFNPAALQGEPSGRAPAAGEFPGKVLVAARNAPRPAWRDGIPRRFLARGSRLLPLLLLVFALPSLAQRGPTAGEAALAQQIEAIISEGDAARGFWGIEVYAPARGRVIYQRNARRFFTPASVAKLFTTAAALDLLGPDHRFRTVVGARGRIDQADRLLGNLYLVGGGDPDLGGCALPYVPETEDEEECDPAGILDRLAARVAERGIRTVTGDLIIDQTFFAPEPYPTRWELGDLLWRYGAPVRALSLADNSLRITVRPGERVRDAGVVTWEPFTRFYDVVNRTWTAPPGTDTLLWVRRDPGSRLLEISGPVALDNDERKISVAVEEPSEFIGELFREALERANVKVLGRTQVDYAPAPPFTAEQTGRLPLLLAEHLSLPLVEDIRFINKVSQNLHAEMLLRHLGRQAPPESSAPERPRGSFEPPPRRGDASTEAGVEVLRAWLASAGVNVDDVALEDGSGLARRNLVTPHAVVTLLAYAEAQPWAPLFRDSLAVAGVDGTLEQRMLSATVRGRIRAKTGTLAHANALAGYGETRAGERLVFAFFFNQHTMDYEQANALLDRLCEALVDLPLYESKNENRKTKSE